MSSAFGKNVYSAPPTGAFHRDQAGGCWLWKTGLFNGEQFPEAYYRLNVVLRGAPDPLCKFGSSDSTKDRFYEKALQEIDFSRWDTSNVTSMKGMFFGCRTFTGKGFGNWDVSRVTDMGYMFSQCYNLEADLSKWDTSNVTNMGYMFDQSLHTGGGALPNAYNSRSYYNYKITWNVKGFEEWDVSNVTNMECMFRLVKLADVDLGKWDVSRVTKMREMFLGWEQMHSNAIERLKNDGPKRFQGDGLEKWQVSKETDMVRMFSSTRVQPPTFQMPKWYDQDNSPPGFNYQ
jgi:surface protein